MHCLVHLIWSLSSRPDNPAKAGMRARSQDFAKVPGVDSHFLRDDLADDTKTPLALTPPFQKNVLSKSKLWEDKEAAMNLGLLRAIAAFPPLGDRVFDVSRAAFLL